MNGGSILAGVVTRVQLKHDEGKDTGGCALQGSVVGATILSNGTGFSDINPNDFKAGTGRLSGGKLNTANGGNWYIDTPFATEEYGRRSGRYFQMHVTVTDEDKRSIDGLDAWYGWAYNVTAWDAANRGNTKVSWKIWPSPVNTAHKDPKFHYTGDTIRSLVKELGG